MEILDNTAFAALALGLFFGYLLGFANGRASQRAEGYHTASAAEVVAKLSPQALQDAKEALRGVRKIEAIKIIRADTQAGLREAKEAMEMLLADIS